MSFITKCVGRGITKCVNYQNNITAHENIMIIIYCANMTIIMIIIVFLVSVYACIVVLTDDYKNWRERASRSNERASGGGRKIMRKLKALIIVFKSLTPL